MASMSSLNLKHLLFLLVLLVSCALGSSHSRTDGEAMAPKPGFDYFILSLQWPNGFCSEVPCRPSPPTQQYFTVHGLWPQNNRGSTPMDCKADPVRDEVLLGLKDGLMTYWPRLFSANDFNASKKFWKEEWSKHGSCSSNKFPPKEYFERGIALGQEYGQKILNYLKNGAVEPDSTTKYSYTKISKAINKGMGMGKEVKVSITCNNDTNGKQQLLEVHLCFDADAEKLINCIKEPSSCSGGFIFASKPPPRRYPSTHTPSLGLASFKLDVEETAEF